MKKFLLFSLALSLTFGAMADEKKTAKKSTKMVNSRNKIDLPVKPTQDVPIVSSSIEFKGTETVERVYVGKSANIYSVLLEEQRYIDYNNDIKAYSFTFRTDPDTYPEALNSGNIITSTSIDGGNTWGDSWMMNTEDPCRYPAGAVYNPDGNTDPNNAYIIATGPVYNDGWSDNFFASSKLNGEDLSYELIPVDPDWSGFQTARNGLQVCSDGIAHIADRKFQDNGSGYSTEMSLSAWSGEFNGSSFDWDLVEIPVDLAMREGGSNPGTTKNFWTFGNAWSNDGSVGYIWMIGVDAELDGESGYSPIIFKTTNQGEDWDQIEIDLADNEVMSEYIWACDQFNGPVWPMCTELDGIVDANGELQLFVKATGTFSSHTDSLGYSYNGNIDYIYNIEVNDDGVQNVIYVDSIVAEDVPADSPYGLGAEGWGSRLRASRTADGSAVFVVWSDTEAPDNFEGQNGAPNIKAAGRLLGGDFADFPSTNFTGDDLYAGFYFFHNVGHISKIEDNYVHIPVTTTTTPAEFSSGTELTPVSHSFVKDIKYLWVEGIEESSAMSSFSVSQNSPNPFTGSTTIELSSEVVAPVNVEVTNLMGQSVYKINVGTIINTMKVELPATNLKAGVYFYTVTIGNESISKKMIVE